MNRNRLICALATGLIMAVLAAHWPVLSAQALAFDDGEFLTHNPLVQDPSWASARRFITEVLEPSTVHGYYIPLTMISLMLDHAAGGRPDDLRQFHRTNLLLHLLATLAVFALLQMLFGNPWIAALPALLYGVHPLTVEPVAWIAERKTVLATCLALWSLVCYVGYTRRGSRKLYVASLAASVLALLAKPTTVPLPVLLLILDYWPLGRLSPRSVVEKVPYFVAACASAVVTVVSNARTANITMPTQGADASALVKIPYNLLFYATKIVWPRDLTPYYAPPEPFDLSHPMVRYGLIAMLGAIVALFVSLRRTRAWAAGALFFLTALLPTLGIVGFSWINVSDKYLYFPAVGLLLALGWWLNTIWERGQWSGAGAWRRVAVIVVVLALAISAAAGTRRYLARWSTSESLYTHMIALAPRAGVIHYSLASTLLGAGRNDEAVKYFRTAAELSPNMPDVYVGLGNALMRTGRSAEAAPQFAHALRINPDSVDAHNGMGMALAARGLWEEAASHYSRAIQIRPDSLEVRLNLGAVRLRQQRLAEAEAQFRAAIRIDPRSPGAHVNLGVVLKARGDYDGAIRHYKIALQSDPTHPEIHRNIALALGEQGKTEEANVYFANAMFCQGLLLERRGDRDGAVALYKKALELVPNHKEAAARLGASPLSRGGK